MSYHGQEYNPKPIKAPSKDEMGEPMSHDERIQAAANDLCGCITNGEFTDILRRHFPPPTPQPVAENPLRPDTWSVRKLRMEYDLSEEAVRNCLDKMGDYLDALADRVEAAEQRAADAEEERADAHEELMRRRVARG